MFIVQVNSIGRCLLDGITVGKIGYPFSLLNFILSSHSCPLFDSFVCVLSILIDMVECRYFTVNLDELLVTELDVLHLAVCIIDKGLL